MSDARRFSFEECLYLGKTDIEVRIFILIVCSIEIKCVSFTNDANTCCTRRNDDDSGRENGNNDDSGDSNLDEAVEDLESNVSRNCKREKYLMTMGCSSVE